MRERFLEFYLRTAVERGIPLPTAAARRAADGAPLLDPSPSSTARTR